MIHKNLHFWISVAGGLLIALFAHQTHFFLSYMLRVPGMLLTQYTTISGVVDIGYGAIRLSLLSIAFYAFLIYAAIWLISRMKGWRHRAFSFGAGIG